MDERLFRIVTESYHFEPIYQDLGWCPAGRFKCEQADKSIKRAFKRLVGEIADAHGIEYEEAEKYAKDAAALSRDLAALLSCPLTITNAYVFSYITDRGPTSVYSSRSLVSRVTRRAISIFFRASETPRYVANDPEKVIETAREMFEAIEYDARRRTQRLSGLWK